MEKVLALRMLVLIFTFLSFFAGSGSSMEASAMALQDSVKRPPGKNAPFDSTGRFLTVNRIFIVGNRITRDQIILRELTLKQKDVVYSNDLPSIIELDRRKLMNTRLFNVVEIRTMELEPDHIDLLVNLNERWYTFPAPIFELSDRNFNEWWQNYNHDFRRVYYGLRLYQFNMRGRNETLRFLAQFGYLRRFELTYRFPYIDKKQKQGLIIDLDFSEAKNLAYRTVDHKLLYLESSRILRTTRGAGITYTFRNSFYESHGLKLEYRSVNLADTVVVANPRYLGEEKKTQQYASLTYSFTSDHRDYIAYPLRGYYINTTSTKAGLTAKDDLNKFETTLTLSGFLDLKKGFFLSNNTVGYWSTPKTVPYANFGALGYRRQFVRGYEVYVIEGPYFFLNKTTFKKRLFSKVYNWKAMPIRQFRHIPLAIYVKTYADLGYVQNYPNYQVNSRLTNKMLSSIGFGLDIVGSYDAVFRFEYTYNAEGMHGFFFNLKREF